MKDYSILIGGAAGEGSKKAGLIIAKLFSSYGYQIYIYEDYQSLIKGGHNFSLIRASQRNNLGFREDLDFLIALNQDTLDKHKKKVRKDGLILDSVQAQRIVKEYNGLPIMKNTALVAALAKTIGIKWLTVEKVLRQELPIETDFNLKIALKSYQETEQKIQIEKVSTKKRYLLSGNEAIALGSLQAGLETYIAYPMTPSTGILNYLASVKGITVVQPENEISAVNMAIGCAFSGKKTMTGTSGGGFCLMNEGISLATQAEVPLVVVNGQRMGPSTGVPTYGGQSDLLHVLSSGHGDSLRFIVAPGDAEQAFFLSGLALSFSWKYQIPAIILSDKDLCEGTFSVDQLKSCSVKPELWHNKGEYLRYQKTKSGISPLAFPGNSKAVVKATSYEHDEKGIAVEDSYNIKEMQEKRKRKFLSLRKEVDQMKCVNVFGNQKSKKVLITWGSTKNPVIEAGEKKGLKIIQPLVVQPFPEKEIKKHLKGKLIVSIENNSTGQMSQLLKQHGIKVDKEILKYDGRCFTAKEIYGKI